MTYFIPWSSCSSASFLEASHVILFDTSNKRALAMSFDSLASLTSFAVLVSMIDF